MSDVNWAADVLRKHNLWRRDAGSDGEHEQQSPADIGRAIDIAVASLASRPGWLPIESAPRDGTAVLLWSASGEETVVGEWIKCASPYWFTGLSSDFGAAYTHWQPLPPPPTKAACVGSGQDAAIAAAPAPSAGRES